MSVDRRLTPANGRVAARHLKGTVQAERYVDGVARQVTVPVADLLDAPQGGRERQLLMGEDVTVFETRAGFAFVQAKKDSYVGYLDEAQLGAPAAMTHRVTVRATHLYPKPDMKTQERSSLPFGAQLQAKGTVGRFCETPDGFVPAIHLSPADHQFDDPISVAEQFIGTPYLWGGNSAFGIDCSGLVQAALLSCGIDSPGDSDMQARAVGRAIASDDALRRGDLLFWPGHVAMVVDTDRVIHANAHHMAVAYEGITAATARIHAAGDGDVTARRRPD